MSKMFALFVSLIASTLGLPIEEMPSEDILSKSNIDVHQLANTLMSPHIDESSINLGQTLGHFSKSEPELDTLGVRTSHMIETAKDTAIGTAVLPIKVMAESAAVGGAIPAIAAMKGTVVGSAIATPIIVKAVALPSVAAGKTAALFAAPAVALDIFTHNFKTFPQLFNNNLKASFEDSAVGHQLENLFLVDSANLSDEGSLALNKGTEKLAQTAEVLKIGALGLKAGALGLATKGLVAAKKGAYVAGRIILKPIAIIAGAHLKMVGTGLVIGGKLVGGTGAGIAKTGTAVKYAGLGSIGLGASAISWGLDKTTLDNHSVIESNKS